MALSAAAPRNSDEVNNIKFYPVAASAKCYQGGIAVINATGYVQPGTAATGLTAVGIFDFTADVLDGVVDNTGGADGAVNARVREGIFLFANKTADLVVQGDVEGVCYIYDDATVCHTGSSKSVAGIVRRVDSRGVWVWIGAPWTAALTAEAVSRAAITTALALETTPGGASYVGIFDTAAKFTATNVEAALAENIDGKRLALGAAANTIGFPLIGFQKAVPNTVGDVTIPLNATYGGIQVIDVIVIKSGSTGGDATITVKNGSSAITDTMALNGLTTGMIKRPTTLTAANSAVASGGTITITAASATSGDMACTVFILGCRIA